MKYREFRRVLGDLAHKEATEQYKATYGTHHLLYHNFLRLSSGKEIPIGSWGHAGDMGRGLNRADLGDPYLAWLVQALQSTKKSSFPLDPSLQGFSRQPDLASIELHEVYELKPDTPNQRRQGLIQLRAFRMLLQQGDREHLATRTKYPSKLYPRLLKKTWTDGVGFLPSSRPVSLGPLGTVTLSYKRAAPGLIVWQTDANREEVKRKVEVLARDVVKLEPRLPDTEEQAQQRARQLLDQRPGFARSVARVVLTVGIAVAAIALTAAIISLAPAVGAVAVVFAFALALSVNSQDPRRQTDGPRLTRA